MLMTVFLLLVFATTWYSCPVSAQQVPPSERTTPETLDHIRQQVVSIHDRIDSLSVTYRTGGYKGPDYPTGTFSQVILATNTNGNFFHDSSKGYPGFDWREDPFRQVAYIRGNELFNVYPVNRAFFRNNIQLESRLPGSLNGEFYFLATGIWPFKQRQRPTRGKDKTPHMLIDVLNPVNSNVVVQQQLEWLNDRCCHVIQNSRFDKIWLDVDRGSAVIKRQFFDHESGLLMGSYEMGDHIEVADGIWLPGWIINRHYGYRSPDPSRRDEEILNSKTAILEVTLNKLVDDTRFKFEIPAGSFEFNNKDIRLPGKQTSAGGIEHFENLKNWIIHNCRVNRQPNDSDVASPFVGHFVFQAACGVTVAMIVLEISIRIFRRKKIPRRKV